MKKGFTLIETLIAITVLLLVLTGPLSLAVKSISASLVSQNQITAFYLAQEAMEYVLNRRDSNALKGGGDWLAGLGPCRSPGPANPGCVVDAHMGTANSCAVPCTKVMAYDNSIGFYNVYLNDNQAPSNVIHFQRLITIDEKTIKEQSDAATVEVKVTWPEKFGGERSLILQREIFNWK